MFAGGAATLAVDVGESATTTARGAGHSRARGTARRTAGPPDLRHAPVASHPAC